MRYYSDPHYKGWSATAIREGRIYGCWGDDPEEEPHECAYCGAKEPDDKEWETDKYGYICPDCKKEQEE